MEVVGKIAGVGINATRGETKTRNFEITKICVVSYNTGPETGFKLVDLKGSCCRPPESMTTKLTNWVGGLVLKLFYPALTFAHLAGKAAAGCVHCYATEGFSGKSCVYDGIFANILLQNSSKWATNYIHG